jgi:hypothetical protein
MVNMSDISAEMLLNHLYPDMEEQWKVQNMGTFYRNYNCDVLSWNAETKEVQVARDGFARLLPQGLLFQNDSLKGDDKEHGISEQNSRMRLLRDMFQPFDTFAFRQKLTIERQVSALLDSKLEYVLKTYFHFDLAAEQNPYVREMGVLLPFVRNMRGDLLLIRDLLAALLGCEVTMTKGRYSHTDNTRCWLPMVKYELLVSHLAAEQYLQLSESIEPLRLFLQEWLLPFEVKSLLAVKWHYRPARIGKSMVLDYDAACVAE